MLTYKGYNASIKPDSKSKTFKGKVVDLSDALFFEAKTFDELEERFEKTVDSYLDFCKKIGKNPEKPFSGRLLYRTDSQTHKQLVLASERTGTSINTLMDSTIKAAFCQQPG